MISARWTCAAGKRPPTSTRPVTIRVVRWLRPTLSRRFADPAPVDGEARSPEEFAVLVLEDVTADRVSEELLRQQARRHTRQ